MPRSRLTQSGRDFFMGYGCPIPDLNKSESDIL